MPGLVRRTYISTFDCFLSPHAHSCVIHTYAPRRLVSLFFGCTAHHPLIVFVCFFLFPSRCLAGWKRLERCTSCRQIPMARSRAPTSDASARCVGGGSDHCGRGGVSAKRKLSRSFFFFLSWRRQGRLFYVPRSPCRWWRLSKVVSLSFICRLKARLISKYFLEKCGPQLPWGFYAATAVHNDVGEGPRKNVNGNVHAAVGRAHDTGSVLLK